MSRLVLLFAIAGCSPDSAVPVDPAPSEPPTALPTPTPTPTPAPPTPLPAVEGCDAPLIDDVDRGYGAIRAGADGSVFVLRGRAPVPWVLAELDSAQATLVPQLELPAGVVHPEVLEVTADHVRVFEEYPSASWVKMDRSTGDHVFEDTAYYPGSVPPHDWQGAQYRWGVDASLGCEPCILRTDAQGDTVAFDDGDVSFTIESDALWFVDGRAWVATEPTADEPFQAVRAIELQTGDVEVVWQSSGPTDVVIGNLFGDAQGNVHWLYTAGPASPTFQLAVYDAATATLDLTHDEVAMRPLLQLAPLARVGDTVLWAEEQGLMAYDLATRVPTVLQQTDTDTLYFDVAGDRVWYSAADAGGANGLVGCVPLP